MKECMGLVVHRIMASIMSFSLLIYFIDTWAEIFPIIDILDKCKVHAIGILLKNNFFSEKNQITQ